MFVLFTLLVHPYVQYLSIWVFQIRGQIFEIWEAKIISPKNNYESEKMVQFIFLLSLSRDLSESRTMSRVCPI